MNHQQILPPSPPTIKKRNSFDLTLLENHHHHLSFLKVDHHTHLYSNSAPSSGVPMTHYLKASSISSALQDNNEDDNDFLLYRPTGTINSSSSSASSSSSNSPIDSVPDLNFFPDLSSF
ncbi:unnamed protein product [Cunninghamella echinulata]